LKHREERLRVRKSRIVLPPVLTDGGAVRGLREELRGKRLFLSYPLNLVQSTESRAMNTS
jgi:hypothetical protein